MDLQFWVVEDGFELLAEEGDVGLVCFQFLEGLLLNVRVCVSCFDG